MTMLMVGPSGQMVQWDARQARERRLARVLRRWWRSLDGVIGRMGTQAWMLSLTYRPGDTWEARDITRFLQGMKERGECTAYCWVAELQARGEVHYHVVVVGSKPRYVRQRWGHGITDCKPCWSVGYLLKYLWKGGEVTLPKGCHRYGAWIGKGVIAGEAEWIWRLARMPGWVQDICDTMGGLAHRTNGGLWNFDCGFTLTSGWRRY